MLEKEYGTTRVNQIDPPTGFEATLNIAGDIAASRNLDQMTSEALSKFATITYRINQVRTDFEGFSGFKFNFQIPYDIGFDENNVLMRHKVSRKQYPDFISTHTTMAFNLYNQYLNGDENARLAAREVQDYIRGLSSAK